jgi:protein TonB
MPPRPAPAPRHRRLALAALTALVLALHGWVLGPAWTAFELRHAPARALPVVTLSQIRPPAPPPPAPPPAPAPRPGRPEAAGRAPRTHAPARGDGASPPDRARPDADLDRPGMDAPPPSADDEAHALQPLVSPAPWLVGYTATKGPPAAGRSWTGSPWTSSSTA